RGTDGGRRGLAGGGCAGRRARQRADDERLGHAATVRMQAPARGVCRRGRGQQAGGWAWGGALAARANGRLQQKGRHPTGGNWMPPHAAARWGAFGRLQCQNRCSAAVEHTHSPARTQHRNRYIGRAARVGPAAVLSASGRRRVGSPSRPRRSAHQMSTASSQIDHLLNETRRFAPPAEFAAQAVATAELYEQAAEDLEGFWAERARELVHWHTPFTEVLDWNNPPFAKWFADGELNVAYNCLDRHVEAGIGDRVALLWEGE